MNKQISAAIVWLQAHPWATTATLIALQISLLVVLASLLSRLCRSSGKWKHRVWATACLLSISLLPAYLTWPNWLSAQVEMRATSALNESSASPNIKTARSMERSIQARPIRTTPIDSDLDGDASQTGLETVQPTLPMPRTSATPQSGEGQSIKTQSELDSNPFLHNRATASSTEANATTPLLMDMETPAMSRYDLKEKVKTNAMFDETTIFMWMLVVYFCVLGILLSKTAFGWWKLSMIKYKGHCINASSLEIAIQSAATLKLRKLPTFICCEEVQSPMSWGILHPQILLPNSFDEWSHECRRAVLLHELSHVARHDAFIDFGAIVCQSVYWFHPAVHFMARSLVRSREEATDERVLECGIAPTTYAKRLLEVVERIGLVNEYGSLPAMHFATQPEIESRIRRVLEYSRASQSSWSIWRQSIVAAFFVALVFFALPLRLIPARTASVAEGTVVQDSDQNAQESTFFEQAHTAPIAAAETGARPLNLNGIVRGPDFKAANAIVTCWYVEGSTPKLFGRTNTDLRGRYSLDIAVSDQHREKLCCFAIDADNRIAWNPIYVNKSDKTSNIPLLLNENTGRIEGTVMAPGEKRVNGIELEVTTLYHPSGGYLVTSPFSYRASADDQGHFIIEGLPSKRLADIRIVSKDWVCRPTIVATSPGTPRLAINFFVGAETEYFASHATIKLFPKTSLTGTVVDTAGVPVPGAKLVRRHQLEAITDENGRFTIYRFDLEAWGIEASESHNEDIVVVEAPEGSRLSRHEFKIDHDQLSSRIIKPFVLDEEFVSGRILSATSKEPLSGVKIESRDMILRRPGDKDVSDSAGRFRLLVRPGQHEFKFIPSWFTPGDQTQFVADASKTRSVRQVDVLSGEPANLGTVSLNVETPGVKPVTVKVVMSDGTPVANCRIELSKSDQTTHPMAPKHHASLMLGDSIVPHIVTNQEGIANVQPATGWSSRTMPIPDRTPREIIAKIAPNIISAFHSEQSVQYFGSVSISDVTDDVVEIKLVEGARIRGKVLLNGQPFEGAKVFASVFDFLEQKAFERTGREVGTTLESTESDELGQYEIYAPPFQGYTLGSIDFMPSFRTSVSSVRVTTTDDPLQFEAAVIEGIMGKGTIGGTVVDENGKPVAGTEVGCLNPLKQIWLSRQINRYFSFPESPYLLTHTDTEGNFAFVDLPEGLHQLVVTDNSPVRWHSKARWNFAEASTGQTDVELVKPSNVTDKK